MIRSFLLIIASFFLSSSIAIASVFPEGSHKAGLWDEYMGLSDESEVKLQCESSGNRLWLGYEWEDSRVSNIRAWCNDQLVIFGIEVNQANFDDRCHWDQFGSYGNYWYKATFLHYWDFHGSPRISIRPICSDGSGGY